jgi:uncharacterized membrane protein YgcG
MKHLIKKRYASLLIVVLLLFGIITALTGCMNEDSTNDVYQSDIKVKDATSEFYVNDYGNILSSEQRTELVKRAKALNEDYNGIQLVITTLESLDGYSIEEYATAMYNKFGIGTKDMGALILFSSGDRQVRIEVGRGMEEYMTDADAGALIDEYAIDYFKNDQFADGIVALQKAVVTFIKNEVPVEWNSALGDEQTSKNTSDVAQSIDESVNTVQAVDNSDVKNSSIADEQSDSGFPMLFWMFVIVVPYGIALGLLYSSVKKYKALRQKNEEMVNENSVQIKHYKYTIDEMEQDAWDIKAEYQKKYNEYEKKLKNCQREKDELKKLIEKMQETHARAIVLHPRLEDEIIEMIENEHKAEAKKVDDAIQSALTNKASKENVDVFGNALAKYNSASMEAKGYVRSDIKVLNQLYEQSSALQKEFQKSEKEKADRNAAKVAYDEMRKIADGVKGNKSTYETLAKANNLYVRLSGAQKRFFPDSRWLREFQREFEISQEDHSNYEKAKKTEKAVKGITDYIGTPDENDINKLKQAIRMYDSLSSSERNYFDRNVYETARRMLAEAEEDQRERERRRKRRDDDDDDFGGGGYHGGSSSFGSFGGGGISNGGGASRGF